MIRQYVRKNKRKKPVGILVAFKDENGVHVGWSQCNKTDRFDKNVGVELAVKRAKVNVPGEVPHLVTKMLVKFKERVARYFKDA